jgi:hypothetical protein
MFMIVWMAICRFYIISQRCRVREDEGSVILRGRKALDLCIIPLSLSKQKRSNIVNDILILLREAKCYNV